MTRYGRPITGIRFSRTGSTRTFAGIGTAMPGDTDVALGRKRARAAVLLELALPGGAYVYQGDELGLEEVEDLPRSRCRTRPGIGPGTPCEAGTAAGCRFPGRGRSRRSDSGGRAAALAAAACALGRADRRRPGLTPGSMLNLYRAALADVGETPRWATAP